MPSRCREIAVRVLCAVVMFAGQKADAQTSPHGTLRWACEACHTTDSWSMRSDAAFDHAGTGFSLEGQHKTVRCASCHKELKFVGMSRDCATCHVDVHKAELGPLCERCHTPRTWKMTDMIQRHQLTRFPLLGRHATLDCQDCHARVIRQQYLGTPITCYGCHRTDYQKTSSPDHAAAGFSTECNVCHKANAFLWGAGFDHSLTTFPLTGVHASTPCISCHKSPDFKSTPMVCYPCHQTDYQATTAPNHLAAQFPTACQTCHTPTGWLPSVFSHDKTSFSLTGAHRAVSCNACHVNNKYVGLSANCVDCHRADFNGAANPNHAALGFPLTCAQCHSTTSWQPASFNHAATKFPLTGKHTTTACASCHVNGNYQLVYNSCFQCHTSDYNGTKNPVHSTSGYPTTCETCHSTTTWAGATFSHTRFPQTHGNAAGVCAKCHSNSANYAVFSCTTAPCHPQSQTDATHRGRSGYVYNSTNCYSCHPRG
jgi:hypothetical protein